MTPVIAALNDDLFKTSLLILILISLAVSSSHGLVIENSEGDKCV